jgi:hypothetical protein
MPTLGIDFHSFLISKLKASSSEIDSANFHYLTLKGQMLYVDEFNSILFLGAPM